MLGAHSLARGQDVHSAWWRRHQVGDRGETREAEALHGDLAAAVAILYRPKANQRVCVVASVEDGHV